MRDLHLIDVDPYLQDGARRFLTATHKLSLEQGDSTYSIVPTAVRRVGTVVTTLIAISLMISIIISTGSRAFFKSSVRRTRILDCSCCLTISNDFNVSELYPYAWEFRSRSEINLIIVACLLLAHSPRSPG